MLYFTTNSNTTLLFRRWILFPLPVQSQPKPSLTTHFQTSSTQVVGLPSTQVLDFPSTQIDLRSQTLQTETISSTETSKLEDFTEPTTNTNDRVPSTETAITSSYTETTTTVKPIISAVVQEVNLSGLINTANKTFSALINHHVANDNVAAEIIPYKCHPLFHYLENKNTLTKDNIFRFRNTNNGDEVATLILKPVAKAVAGDDGKAMAMTLSRAILKQGTNVDVLYEPEAVAIAGPGGLAHAQTDLEVFYHDAV